MTERDPINPEPGASRLRSALAAVGRPLRGAFLAVEDRVLWDGRNALRRAFDVARWPFERLTWAAETRLVWPLRERLAGWSTPTRAAGAGVLSAIAVGAVALGAILATGDGGETSPPETLAVTEPSAAEPSTSPPEPAPAEPVLQGAPPALGLDAAVATAKPSSEEVTKAPGPESAESSSEAASASSSEVEAAGPDAMKVARRFAEAFVVYEVGEQQARARATFDATAAPALAGALAKRPPRLPEKVKVPQAKVVNLVPGPRRGKAYSVSVALLRVGVTSELRLELRRNTDGWLVTDVRG